MNFQDLNKEIGNIDIYLLDQILKGRYQQTHRILDAGCGFGGFGGGSFGGGGAGGSW